MKKAFGIFEVLILIFILTIILTFFIPKYQSSIEKATNVKIKSNLALIRNAIQKKRTKYLLLNTNINFKLDSADIESKNSKLFENILDFPFVSTNSTDRRIGEWIKKGENLYIVYIKPNQFVEYEYKDFSFTCISTLKLCEKFE